MVPSATTAWYGFFTYRGMQRKGSCHGRPHVRQSFPGALSPFPDSEQWRVGFGKWMTRIRECAFTLARPGACSRRPAAQPALPDQTTYVPAQQITIYDATLAANLRNRRMTMLALRNVILDGITAGANIRLAADVATGTVTISGEAGGGGGSTTFVGLTDTPSSYTNNRYLRSSSGALVFRTNGQVRADIGANNASNLNAGTIGDARIPAGIARDSEIVTTFVGLTDTPAALVADMCLAVNAAGTAVVLQACATGGGGASSSVTSLTFEAVGGVLNLRQSIGGTQTATGFMTPTLVDARIDPAARIPPIGTFADQQMPTNVARLPQLPIVAAGTGISVAASGGLPNTYTVTATGGGGGTDGVVDDASFADRVLTLTRTNGLADLTATLPNSVITSQIASWARVNNPTGQIADVFIPATIARDSELPVVAAGTGISVVPTGTLPTTYTVTATGGGGGSDGVVDGASFAGRVLTLTRSNGLANLTATLGTAAIDDRIVSWARVTNPTGTINDVFIPAGIARDTELPIVAAGTNVTVDQVGTTYTVNATGGGGRRRADIRDGVRVRPGRPRGSHLRRVHEHPGVRRPAGDQRGRIRRRGCIRHRHVRPGSDPRCRLLRADYVGVYRVDCFGNPHVGACRLSA